MLSASQCDKEDYKPLNENSTFSLPALPYAYNSLEPVLWTQQIFFHHKREHQIMTDNLNEYLTGYSQYQNLKITELVETYGLTDDDIANLAGAYYNQCLLWWIYTPASCNKDSPEGPLLTQIQTQWGSFSTFKSEFESTARSLFGSGWVWLCSSSSGLLSIKAKQNEYSPLAGSECYPFLGINLWEHAYYIAYMWDKSTYIKYWWSIVDWDMIEYWYDTYASIGIAVPV